jgi:hypothetical protein
LQAKGARKEAAPGKIRTRDQSRRTPRKGTNFGFRVEGQEAGRCYHHYVRFYEGFRWHWTVYESNFAGDELMLQEAQAKFKAAFEKGRI